MIYNITFLQQQALDFCIFMCTTWGILIFIVKLTDFKLRKHWCILYAIYLFKQFVNNYWSFERIDHASTDACYLVNFMEVVECKNLKINLTVSEFSKAKNSFSASWFSNVWIRFNNLRVDKCLWKFYRIKVGKYVCYTLWGMREEEIIMLYTKKLFLSAFTFS